MIRRKSKSSKKTYIAFILDKSGSMESIRDVTISSFNELLQQHKSEAHLGGQTTFTLTQFNGNVEESLFNVPIEEVAGKLSREDYAPSGGTALYDAVMKTLKKLSRFDESGDVGFLVVILSDGQENSSRQATALDVKNLIDELKETGRWTFQYVGCDDAALAQAKATLGVDSFKFDKSAMGLLDLTNKMKTANSIYYNTRSVGSTRVESFLGDTED
jgi:hypothetical protein